MGGMHRLVLTLATLLVGSAWSGGSLAAAEDNTTATVICNEQTVVLERFHQDGAELWVTPKDLTRINGFELKPEGACLAELCIPVLQGAEDPLVTTRDDTTWFSLTALARRLSQAVAVDEEQAVWSFGPIPQQLSARLESGAAPDFELTDVDGRLVRLSDFHGKKVLILTWASW